MYHYQNMPLLPTQVIGSYGTPGWLYVVRDAMKAGDKMGPRPGIVYRLHVIENSARLHFGAKVITFPTRFREAIDFALNTPVYALGDIYGELGDQEKIVFAERLLQEGLVIRKSQKSS